MSYIIVGDTKEYKGCLVYLIGGDKSLAERTLQRMLNNPTEGDRKLLETHTNLRVTEEAHGWWDDEYKYLSTM